MSETVSAPKRPRGFASMSPEQRRAIASKGGRAAHEKGTAHCWTTEEARSAGRKRGYAREKPATAAPPVLTKAPPRHPPDLRCPWCGWLLQYRVSVLSGPHSVRVEQWDVFDCATCKQRLEYRHSTRSIRIV
jgi:general stress protein YciG